MTRNVCVGVLAAAFVCPIGTAAADESLRDWINTNLKQFGAVIAEPRPQTGNTQIYYFQTNVNYSSTSPFPVIATITCTPVKEGGAVCTAGNVTGAPPGFPSAFRSAVFP